MRSRRGFSLAEVLTVFVIVGLMLSAVAFAIPLFLNGPREAQSQVDEVESTALALYKMQQDTRPSNIGGVFACNTFPIPTCSQPAPQSPMPTFQSIVVLTADDVNGQFQLSGGRPQWQGFVVYWLTPNADGTSNELRRAYVPGPPVGPPAITDAVVALVTALGLTSYTTVAQDVHTLAFAVDTPHSTVDIQLDGGDYLKGNKTSIQLAGNSYVRN